MKCSTCRTKHVETTTKWERFKQWLLHKMFHEELIDFSQDKYTQGFGDGYKTGFGHAKDQGDQQMEEFMEDTMVLEGDWLVKPEDVLVVTKDGRLFLGNDQVTTDTIKQLKAEVGAIKSFKVWSIIQETLRQKAIEKAVLHSSKFEETLSGKLMVHSIGVIKSILTVIEKKV